MRFVLFIIYNGLSYVKYRTGKTSTIRRNVKLYMYKTIRNTFSTTSSQLDELLLPEFVKIFNTFVIYVTYALFVLTCYCKVLLALYVLYKQFKHNQSIEYTQ